MTQRENEFFTVMRNYISKEKHSFHTPGHKAGAAFEKGFRDFLQKNIYNLDITVTPFVDSLHEPSGCIKETQGKISALYGAKKSFLLVNGSTLGNLAVFLSLFRDGDSVLISRNIHKSVIAACVISGIYPVWMNPEIIPGGITGEVSSKIVLKYLNSYPETKAVFITSPTYHGIITDVKKIAEVCREFGKILIVDEAWGPHLKFYGNGSFSAVNYADCVIQSFHKILPVFSQGSVLHICSDIPDIENMEKAVSLLSTTSPFYPMLLTMDYAAGLLAKKGKKLTMKMMKLGSYASKKIKALPFARVLDKSLLPPGNSLDTSKITIDFERRGLTGFFIQNFLRKHGIGIDCANPLNVIATLGFGNTKEDVDSLISALKKLPHRKAIKFKEFSFPATPSEIALSPREVYMKYRKKKIPLIAAAGQICAEMLAPYPPGIPVLLPGERITKDVIDYLKAVDLFKCSAFEYGKERENKLKYITVIDV
ncbi:MAG: hypothetical protein COT16_03555 [Elusimicrobia bacterium CG08_land_8_20_14_0_20_44_26]|nr:MAG: hypothetical protein COT16_03555 [Elusimicrobia bacterium CG08_land_8_20_14_0_20_44_26]